MNLNQLPTRSLLNRVALVPYLLSSFVGAKQNTPVLIFPARAFALLPLPKQAMSVHSVVLALSKRVTEADQDFRSSSFSVAAHPVRSSLCVGSVISLRGSDFASGF